MYEFAPKAKKIREKIWMSVCLFFGVLSYSFGQILPYPMACQLLSVILLTGAVLITVRYLLRDYVYCVEVDAEGAPADLVIVEVMGKRRTVVSRVRVAGIGQILLGREIASKKDLRGLQKKEIYRYISQMSRSESVFLEILDDEKCTFLEICADSQLISILEGCKKQYLSDK